MKSRFLELIQDLQKETEIFKMKSRFLVQFHIFATKLRFLERNHKIFRMQSRFLELIQDFQKEIEIFRMKSRFLELIPDFQDEIEIFKMKSRFLELIPNVQNSIEVLNIIYVWPFSATVQDKNLNILRRKRAYKVE